jgi:hypothetical protein
MDTLGLVIIVLTLAAIMAVCWVAVHCGIKPPLEQEGQDWDG